MKRTTDYSLFHLGAINQATYEITIEACRRFGVDKADIVLMTALFSKRNDSKAALINEIIEETNIVISDEDFEFLSKVVTANDLIIQGIAALEACHGK